MPTSRDALADAKEQELGIVFEAPIRAGANYDAAVASGDELYVSGQVPRVQGKIMVTGRVGDPVALADARFAAQVCVLRALRAIRQTLGSLDRVACVKRVTVYVQSASDFTQQSEVADAASDLLYVILHPVGNHTRTSVGVMQLPKNASVEIDMIVGVERASTGGGS